MNASRQTHLNYSPDFEILEQKSIDLGEIAENERRRCASEENYPKFIDFIKLPRVLSIFFWSWMMAYSSASGRGGQPGT